MEPPVPVLAHPDELFADLRAAVLTRPDPHVVPHHPEPTLARSSGAARRCRDAAAAGTEVRIRSVESDRNPSIRSRATVDYIDQLVLHDLATVGGHDPGIAMNVPDVFGWVEGQPAQPTRVVRLVEASLERLKAAGHVEVFETSVLDHLGEAAAANFMRVTPAGREYLSSWRPSQPVEPRTPGEESIVDAGVLSAPSPDDRVADDQAEDDLVESGRYNNSMVYLLCVFTVIFTPLFGPIALAAASHRLAKHRPHAERGLAVSATATLIGTAWLIKAATG
jgi:hypothetical protein